MQTQIIRLFFSIVYGGKMKTKIKEIFKYNKLSIIMCIITLVLGIGFYTLYPMEITIKGKLIRFFTGFLPFFIFLLITILAYHFKGKHKKRLCT